MYVSHVHVLYPILNHVTLSHIILHDIMYDTFNHPVSHIIQHAPYTITCTILTTKSHGTYTIYTTHHTPGTMHHLQYAIRYTPYAICHTPYTIHNTPYTIHNTPDRNPPPYHQTEPHPATANAKIPSMCNKWHTCTINHTPYIH